MEWLNEYNFFDERNEFIARSTITGTINKIYLQLEERKKSLKTYSRTPVTRTLKGNEKLFELAGFRVIGVH